MGENKTLLEMKNISKTFPGVRALVDVDFTLREGEIHALMGENGAGKSTLIKVLTGVDSFETGSVKLGGKSIQAKNPHHAQTLGISTVYQEVNLCTNLTVAENIFIGREPKKFGVIDWGEMNKRTRVLLQKLSLDIDVTRTLENYSVAVQQMVAIARAIDIKSKVLILDEPTSSLDSGEVEKLFNVMRLLKSQGVGIVFVTHFLDQVYEISDKITILRNGNLVGSYKTAELDKIQLVSKMIGKDYDDLGNTLLTDEDRKLKKEPYISISELTGITGVTPIDLEIKKNEVIGLAGLLGSGRSEVARMIFGVDRVTGGTVKINDKTVKISEPIDAIRASLAFCPEDRKTDAIVSELTIRENIILALQTKNGMFKFISKKKSSEIADKYIKMLEIKTPSREQQIRNLSGGNQQKVIIARWLATNPELLILDEPTRGIDVGTKAEIQKIVVDLARKGMAIMFISSELDEMIRCCNRMAVMRDLVKIGELEGKISQDAVMSTIAGGAK